MLAGKDAPPKLVAGDSQTELVAANKVKTEYVRVELNAREREGGQGVSGHGRN